MTIQLGNQTVKNITLGNNQVKRIWRGDNLIWEYNDNDVIRYRFIRLQWSADGGAQLQQVRAFANGVNVLSGILATAVPAITTGGNLSLLTDGNLTTSVQITHWARHVLTFDMGELHPITNIIINRPAAGGGNLIIDVSENGTDWIRPDGTGAGNTPEWIIQ